MMTRCDYLWLFLQRDDRDDHNNGTVTFGIALFAVKSHTPIVREAMTMSSLSGAAFLGQSC